MERKKAMDDQSNIVSATNKCFVLTMSKTELVSRKIKQECFSEKGGPRSAVQFYGNM